MSSLLLVHVAKTGGTSLRRLLKFNAGISRFDCFHNGFLLCFEGGRRIRRYRVDLNSLEQYDTAVISLRHPFYRLQSCYNYFLSGGLNGRGKGVFPGDLASQEFLASVAPTFSSCCQNLSLISGRIPHFYPVNYWLSSLKRPLAKSLICCRQESFVADVNQLFKALNISSSIAVEHRNKGSNHMPSSAISSAKDLHRIEKFYSADFARFGYEANFLQPLQLVQYWNQEEPPLFVAKRMKLCKSLNQDWNYRRFNRKTAAAFLESAYDSDIATAFLDIRLPAMQADVFRVAFLMHCGGLWVDAATSLLRPVECWIDRRYSLQMLRRSHQVHPKIATQLIFAARPGLPLLQAAWSEIVLRLLSRSGTKVYRDFGPGLFRDLLTVRPNLAFGLNVVSELSLHSFLSLGSSSDFLSADQHWSKRQENESLYFSGE